MRLTFSLGRVERRILLERLTDLEGPFAERLQRTKNDAASVNFEMPLEEFNSLMSALEDAMSKARGKRMSELNRVARALDRSAHEVRGGPAPGSPSQLLATELERVIEERGLDTEEGVQAALQEVQAAYNMRPQEELGGLSPNQMVRLFTADWHSPDNGIRIRTDLPLEALEDAEIFFNTRLMLRMLLEADGTKATGRGNLNTKFVKAFAEQMFMPDPKDREMLFKYTLAWREHDIRGVGDLRFVAQIAGLLCLIDGKFHITEDGKSLLDDAKAGALYSTMFDAFFGKLDLSCLDGSAPAPSLQTHLPCTFAKLHLLARDWILDKELIPQLYLPRVVAELDIPGYHLMSTLYMVTFRRVFNPLKRFGLIERRRNPSAPDAYFEEVRVTPRFDQFFLFDMDSPARPGPIRRGGSGFSA